MAIQIWLAYVVAVVVVVVIPGPTTLLVSTQTIAHGRKAIAPLVWGVFAGDSAALTLSLLGLGALLVASAEWFTLVKWIGAAYLIYLGISLWRNSDSVIDSESKIAGGNVAVGNVAGATTTSSTPTSLSFFLHSFFVTTFNPKGIIFFIAFLPQFVNLNANVPFQLVVLAVTFIIIGSINALLYALFSDKLKYFLKKKTVRKWFNRCGGSALIGAGVWAATVRHP